MFYVFTCSITHNDATTEQRGAERPFPVSLMNLAKRLLELGVGDMRESSQSHPLQKLGVYRDHHCARRHEDRTDGWG